MIGPNMYKLKIAKAATKDAGGEVVDQHLEARA